MHPRLKLYVMWGSFGGKAPKLLLSRGRKNKFKINGVF
jgi:hypothetical protein